MFTATQIAQGFMNDPKNSLKQVMFSTVEFLGRKLSMKEFNAIKRAYKKSREMHNFYVS